MARTPGAKNRTPRELETAKKFSAKEAKLKRRIEVLKEKTKKK